MFWEKCRSSLAYGLHHISLFFCEMKVFAELRRWNLRPQNNVKRRTVWKCKEITCSTKCDMHWKTHDCNGKWTYLKRISTSFPCWNHWRGNFCAHNVADGIKIKRYCGCIGTSPLSHFVFFSLPMIELCDIFSLDSLAKQQLLFVRHSFNKNNFRAISGPAIFYGSRSDSFKFSESLSAWRVAEVCSHCFQIKIVCFERLFSFWQYVTKSYQLTITWHRNEVDIGRHIRISKRTEHKLLSLQARDWRYRASLLLWAAFLEQGIEMCWIFSDSLVECQWDDILRRTPRAAMIIVRVGFWMHQYLNVWM